MEITQLSLLVLLCWGVHRSTSETLQRQKRNWIIDSFSVEEDYDGVFPYSLGKIKVEKTFTVFKIYGQGVDEEPLGVLEISESTGELFVRQPVDYERYQVLQLTFQALDKESNMVDTQLGIFVRIIDANDFAPEFEHATYTTLIEESRSQGSEVMTVKATDKDISEQFKGINMRIVSVFPEPENLEFYLTHTFPNEFGTVSFKGCLDYEKAKTYTIIVEAKDNGDPKQLSSSCTVIIHIEDQNNHLPVFTDQTSQVKVREDQEDVLILRLPVTDRDTVNTPSWRAKFSIEGQTKNNFRIETDEKTNDGLLYLNQCLNYEENPINNITITVENEVPYYMCKVLERRASGLWKVASSSAKDGAAVEKLATPPLSSQRVTVTVEDVNEAPIFDMANQHVSIMENIPVGKYLKTFTAKDPDTRSMNKIAYKIGNDPADWLTVDSKQGKVTTTQIIDRESSFVNSSIYVATILAVDDGKPPMTGTATLTIHIGDENDHVPFLDTNAVDVCQSDKMSMAPISASDQDIDPNAGPFRFKLLGDVKDKWRVNPNYGRSVKLQKESTVHSGHYVLLLEVSDLQGNTNVQNLTVTVCQCPDPTTPNCRVRALASKSAGGAAVGIIFLSLLLLAALLLLVILFSCKNDKIPMADDASGHLMISNTERPGTDCEVAFDGGGSKGKQIEATSEVKTEAAKSIVKGGATETLLNEQKNLQWLSRLNETTSEYTQFQRESFARGNALRMSLGARPAKATRIQRRASYYGDWTDYLRIQETQLNKMLFKLQTPGRELGDYQPRVYAEEGDSSHSLELDAITISEACFDPNMDLDMKFSNLASVCMPTHTGVHGTEA